MANISGNSANNLLVGTQFNDVIRGKGGDDILKGKGGNDKLKGGSGNDVLKGGGGNDTLNGATGQDFLKGGGGNDLLKGGSGNDVLLGNKGADDMFGGADADVFKFNSGDGFYNNINPGTFDDVIWDFQDGVDLIDLPGIGIASITGADTAYFDATLGVAGTWIQYDSTSYVFVVGVSLDATDFI